MRGKELCEFLKNIRKKLAEANGIPYEARECTHKGDCPGTCPLCEAELVKLTSELQKIEENGGKVNVDVLTEEEKEVIASLSECRYYDDEDEILTGDVPSPDGEDIIIDTMGQAFSSDVFFKKNRGSQEDESQMLMGEPVLEEPPHFYAGIPAPPMEDVFSKDYEESHVDDAVWGAIIGDIAGSRFEFNPTNDFDFEMFTDECSYTDDTICTVAIADALLKGKDFGKSLHDWCRRYPSPMGGYGISFHKWILSDNPQPYNSFGNGAAMRVSPVACWYGKWIFDVMRAAEATAAPTHNHPEGIKGAKAVASVISHAIMLRQGHRIPIDPKEVVDLFAKDYGYNINLKDEDVRNRFDETCQGTVPVALWIIGNSHSFGSAIRYAISLGADADTLGAIVGSIAGAIWGIPQSFIDRARLYLPHEMRDVLRDFRDECKKRDSERR